MTAGGAITFNNSFSSSGATTLTAGSNVNFNGGLTFTALTLNAGANISFTGSLTSTGSITLNAGGNISATQAVSVGTFTLQNGLWSQTGPALPSFVATDFRLSGGTFLRVTGGNGTAGNPYGIADIYGLQGVDSPSLLGKSFRLTQNIDAGATTTWWAGAGFAPIGMPGAMDDGR